MRTVLLGIITAAPACRNLAYARVRESCFYSTMISNGRLHIAVRSMHALSFAV